MKDRYEIITHHFTVTQGVWKNSEMRPTFLYQLWLCALVVALLVGFKFVAWKNSAYTQILHSGRQTRQYLTQAGVSLLVSDWDQAIQSLELGRVEIRKLRTLTQKYLWLPGAAKISQLSRSGEKIMASLDEIAMSIQPESGGLSNGNSLKPMVAAAYTVASESYSTSFVIQELLETLPGKQTMEEKLDEVVSASQIGKSIASFLGDVSSRNLNVLLVMQNNNELRPTGGFFGTYGILNIDNGKPKNLQVSSIYDLDGQLESKQKFQPPLPLLQVNNTWFLRDSNWHADFTESSKFSAELAAQVTGKYPDMVIAMTPDFVTRLLEATGPLEMPEYNISLNAENFVELTQLQTSLAYDKIENRPKELLASALPKLVNQLLSSQGRIWLGAVSAIHRSLMAKDLMFSARDPKLQNKLLELGWSGDIQQAERDNLMIVRSNLSGTKTDRYIKQEVSLKSLIGEAGKITNTLSVTFTNPLPKSESGFNLTFLRILTPKGSQLLSAQGFNPQDLESARAILDYPVHPKALAWESGMVKDLASGSLVGTEGDKTFFGNWLELEGGQSKTVEFTYQLPFSLGEIDHLSLLHQVQPGVMDYEFEYAVSFSDRSVEAIVSKQDIKIQNKDLVTWKRLVDRDILFGIVLAK